MHSVAAESDAGRYNCSFSLGTNLGRQTFTDSIEIPGKSLVILIVA